MKPKMVRYVNLVPPANGGQGIEAEKTRLHKSGAYKQAQLLEFLAERGQPISVNELKKRLNCSLATIKALEKRNLVSVESVRIRRDPLSGLGVTTSPAPPLTSSQRAAWGPIHEAIVGKAAMKSGQSGEPDRRTAMAPLPESYGEQAGGPVFLLFGVTGSGKTEIYLRALAQVVAAGKRGICLIPEIALTRQTVERFASRFPGR
ncbi:MAG: DEAD/DEAH box helicase, partial [Thermoplasmata archaeon]